MIAAKASCRAFDIEKNKSDEELHNKLTEKEIELFKYLSEKTNLSVNNMEEVEKLYSTLKIEVIVLFNKLNSKGMPYLKHSFRYILV